MAGLVRRHIFACVLVCLLLAPLHSDACEYPCRGNDVGCGCSHDDGTDWWSWLQSAWDWLLALLASADPGGSPPLWWLQKE